MATILHWEMGQKVVTDRQTDGQTDRQTYGPRRLLAPVVVDLVVASSSVHRSLVGFKRILSVLMHESCRPILVELCSTSSVRTW